MRPDLEQCVAFECFEHCDLFSGECKPRLTFAKEMTKQPVFRFAYKDLCLCVLHYIPKSLARLLPHHPLEEDTACSHSFVHCSPTKCQVVHQFPCHKLLNWNTLYPASQRFLHTQMNVYFVWVLLHN